MVGQLFELLLTSAFAVALLTLGVYLFGVGICLIFCTIAFIRSFYSGKMRSAEYTMPIEVMLVFSFLWPLILACILAGYTSLDNLRNINRSQG